MKFKAFSAAILLTLAVSGCSTQPLTFNQLGDFTTYPLNTNTFRVSYIANDNITYTAAQNIVLVKAAQTTVLNGYQYFTIVGGPSAVHDKPQRTVTYPYGTWGSYGWGGPGWWGPGPGWGDPFYGMPQVVTTGPAEIAYNIQCYHNAHDAPANAYNASMILETLGQRYGVLPTGQVLSAFPVNKN
ncbi:CC0125/CC1285 family lipoprotein [Commensalibacter oyaizuii]|uniref:DUF4136 domain-containing protein n=1 Tax=Commensalibacter oyaizuii TaxID=3043873 RepID=A0ABT6Q5G4_9PROT|nr:hypothetical protein [Commensalibacter sp. TBRC 16381]MDI2091796.1 hypothetical protein [Commensalibacter sp. TBRC 16381]